jgi:hypothetical protein
MKKSYEKMVKKEELEEKMSKGKKPKKSMGSDKSCKKVK